MNFADTVHPSPLIDKDIWTYQGVKFVRVSKVAEALTKLKQTLWKYGINLDYLIHEAFPDMTIVQEYYDQIGGMANGL